MSDRKSLYTFKVYSEHFNNPIEDIKECLFGYSYAISPCHDLDVKSNTGELKKPHYHINIKFCSPITLNSAIRKMCIAFEKFGGDKVGNFTAPDSFQPAKGEQAFLDRYLCHLDHSDKHQYNTDDIVTGGLYVLDLKAKTSDLTNNILSILLNNNGIRTFKDLVFYLRSHDLNSEMSFVVKHAYFVKSLFK